MSVSRDDILREQLERSVKDILEQLPYMKEVFHNPQVDLNKTVENELDFFLGVAFGEILERYTAYLLDKKIRPTPDEIISVNHLLFSRAPEFKNVIRKLLEI